VWRLIIERQAAEAAAATPRNKYTNKSKERALLQREREKELRREGQKRGRGAAVDVAAKCVIDDRHKTQRVR